MKKLLLLFVLFLIAFASCTSKSTKETLKYDEERLDNIELFLEEYIWVVVED